MPYQQLLLEDIYKGSIDARDEIADQNSRNYFLNSFITPPNFNLDDLIKGRKCFVEGFKGTGKTAVLGYLEDRVVALGAIATSLLFKSEYKDSEKNQLVNLANSILKIDGSSMLNELDFEYIWRWIIFKKIVDDNIEHDYMLFAKNKKWKQFEELIRELSGDKNSKNIFDWLPFRVNRVGNIGSTITVDQTGETTQRIGLQDVSLEKQGKTMNEELYDKFGDLVKAASEVLLELERTETPYYLFVDELEVFFEKNDLFIRDLRMVRDLALTVKWFNQNICKKVEHFYIICALRTEVKNSIKKFVAGKELNKAILGFTMQLKWNYSNNNSYEHPIFQIWLKRIKISEANVGNYFSSDKEIIKKWFCNKVDNTDVVKYVLDNSWNKPRDIVRFLLAIDSTLPTETSYKERVFTESRRDYSKQSWEEVSEELNVAFTPNEIEIIKDFLVNFKQEFTYNEALSRAKERSKLKNAIFLENRLTDILETLFRVGVLGNRSDLGDYRWLHKGNDNLILDDDQFKIVVHRGLWPELSLNTNVSKQRNSEKYNKSGFKLEDLIRVRK